MTSSNESSSTLLDAQSSQTNSKFDRVFLTLLIGGIAIRLIVLIAASPFNADHHLEVIQWIAEHHSLPRGDLLTQSHHPPLYYLLMLPIWLAATALKCDAVPALHIASFLLSTMTLLVLARAIQRHRNIFTSAASRRVSVALASFLPQFVMYGSYVSNDTLTMLLGALAFASIISFIEEPTLRRVVMAGVWCGLGMLTKGTFLLTGVVLVPIVYRCARQAPTLTISASMERGDRTGKGAMRWALIFCAIWLVLGCEKYVDNTIRIGRPFVHNLDDHPKWAAAQTGVWRGWFTLVDVNVIKLIRDPILQPRNPFSYPLLMYGTFWYPHIPDSSFRASIRGYDWVGSTIYAAAIGPTIVFLFGCAIALKRRSIVLIACLAMLIANLAVVLAAGWKFDVWSCFQSRLCFQSMGPMLMLFAVGFDWLRRRRATRWFIDITTVATVMSCLLYFVIEVSDACGLLPDNPERTSLHVISNPTQLCTGVPLRSVRA